MDGTFGKDIDYATLVKIYGPSIEAERRYGPPVCTGAKAKRVRGNPDPNHVSTSCRAQQSDDAAVQAADECIF